VKPIAAARSKGELEAEISRTMTRFKRELLGRGPLQTRTYLIDDLVVVRLKGVLTAAEQRLATGREGGTELVRQMRHELMAGGRAALEQVIRVVLGVAVRSVHSDINPEVDECVIVFSLEQDSPGPPPHARPINPGTQG
jgi:uncharacterized protein YbcI